MKSNRINEKQRRFLQSVADSEKPTEEFLQGLPLYMKYDFMAADFRTEYERDRWIKNMEARRFVRVTKGHFVRLTDLGREALAAAKPTEPTQEGTEL